MANDYTEAVIPHSKHRSDERAIDWHSFLGRPSLPSPDAESLQPLRDASILITGAGGSIGRALSLRIGGLQPRTLVLLDASEQAMFRLQSELKAAGLSVMPTLVLASTANAAEIDEVFALHQPSVVLHAAAHKHVALLEEQPFAAMANNALATEVLLKAAGRHNARRVVLLSTDKAAEPTSMLGATKHIAEQITLAHAGIVVRLANVLGTEGSVVDLFLRRIDAGEPIVIRGRGAERYFLTMDEAVDLLLSAAADALPGSLLIPRLERAHSIVALAEFLIETACGSERPPLVFADLYPGEKVSESLRSRDEVEVQEGKGKALLALAPAMDIDDLSARLGLLRRHVEARDLGAMLDTTLTLVPHYTPSSTVRSLGMRRSVGVVQI